MSSSNMRAATQMMSNNINNNNNNNNHNHGHEHELTQTRLQQLEPSVYTHQLPYGVRKHICDLIDADQSWRLLGGQFMRLDATQLRLVGQALLRNESPTGELLNKLDSANVRVAELANYLEQMGHCRAGELLRPFLAREPAGQLDTPTPSFSSIQPMAALNSIEFNMIAPADYQNQNPDEWQFVEAAAAGGGNNHGDGHHDASVGPRAPCHNAEAAAAAAAAARIQPPIDWNNLNGAPNAQPQQQQQLQPAQRPLDPGDEIVRTACASNRKRTSISDQEVVNQLRLIMQINYDELRLASDHFAEANILGNGGFASVYRGHWKGTDVAIKRLRCNLMDQALNELTILNSYRIDNILPIYGISIDGPEACLVYQFMANGSLEDRLACKRATAPLSWRQRAQIAEGVARGLNYLHTLRDKPLVHGDAKSANVLLDSQFVPKLGDFGLARQVFRGRNPLQSEHNTHCTVSSIHGTSVYLPPEYLRHKILSPAVDVYSYGIVLLEMATGKRAYDGKRLLIDFVEDELRRASEPGGGGAAAAQEASAELNPSLRDHRLAAEPSAPIGQQICHQLLLDLGVNCAHRIKKKRPDMGQVLSHLAAFRLSLSAPFHHHHHHHQHHHHLSETPNLLVSGLAAPASNATTRTLTPDLNQGAASRPNFGPNAGQQLQQSGDDGGGPALMSVEEEGHLLQQLNQRQPAEGEQQDGQIEAMIPLLTELGFSTQIEAAADGPPPGEH